MRFLTKALLPLKAQAFYVKVLFILSILFSRMVVSNFFNLLSTETNSTDHKKRIIWRAH